MEQVFEYVVRLSAGQWYLDSQQLLLTLQISIVSAWTASMKGVRPEKIHEQCCIVTIRLTSHFQYCRDRHTNSYDYIVDPFDYFEDL